jgi:putative inorganic carbon (HCO3(-)) transporter
LANNHLLAILAVGLLGALPFLENAQTGVISFAVTALWLVLWLTNKELPQHPVFLPLGVYWLVAIVATVFSPVRMAALDGLIKLSLYLGIFLAFWQLLHWGKSLISLLVGVYLSTTLVVCGYGIHQWLLGAQELATWTDPTSELAGITRIYSFLGNPNLLAGYLLPAVPLGVVAAWQWRSWGLKALAGLVSIGSAWCILQTYSRGALLGLGGMGLTLILLLVFWWGRKLPKWSLPVFFGSASAAVIGSVLVIPTVRTRVLSIFLGSGDSSNAFRLNVWLAVLKMIKARPLLGIGPGNRAFNQIYPLYQTSGYSALGTYSVPLEITVETGAIGFIVYLWLMITVLGWGGRNLLTYREQRNPDGLWLIGCFSAVAGMIAHGLFDTVWFRPQVQIIWWLCLAIICTLSPPQEILDT